MKTYITNLILVFAIITICLTPNSYGQYSVNINGIQFEANTDTRFINNEVYSKRIIVNFKTDLFNHDIGYDKVIVDDSNKFIKSNKKNIFIDILKKNNASYIEKVYPHSIRGDVYRRHVVTGEIVKIRDISSTYFIHFNDFINVDNISKDLNGFDFVEYVDGPELIVSTSSYDYEPNDSLLNDQWGIEVADLTKAWDIVRDGQRIGVAVSDRAQYYYTIGEDTIPITPIYHEDLQPLANGGNFIDTTLTENMIAPDNHGTMVSGVFGATTDNEIGIAGVAHNTAKVYSYSRFSGGIEDILSDINNYPELDIRIINCSWLGGGGPLETQIQNAMQIGLIVVAGAGNYHPTNGNWVTIRYPAGYDFRDIGLDRVIGVSATWIQTQEEEFFDKPDDEGNRYIISKDDIFSNPKNAHIDITAPGKNIYTTNLAFGDYRLHNGTSLSSPFVAGIISLILSINENLNASDVYDIITKTTDHVSVPDTATFYPHPNDNREWNRFTGYGRVNAYQALIHTIENYGATLGGFNEVVTLHDDIYINEGSVVTIKAGTTLNIKGDIIVENFGELHIEEGVTINADPGTRIVTKPGPGLGPGETGGTLEAIASGNPIIMQPSGGGAWGGIVLESHKNILDNVHISGVNSYPGSVRIIGHNLNTIKNSVIEDNQYGILVDNVNSVSIIDNHIVNNSQEGLVLLNVLDDISTPGVVIKNNTISGNGRHGVFLFGSTIVNFSENIIEDNGQHGIWLSAFSSIYFNYDDYGYNRIKNNDNHQVWLTTTSDAFIGGSQTFGNNTIYHTNQPSTNKLIYRLALTGSGYQQATYQVFAQQTYWGHYSVSSGPFSSQFVGNVDYSNHLSSDPTIGSGPSSHSQPLAGGSVSTQTLMSADMMSAVTSAYEGNLEGSRRAIGLYKRVMHLRDVLANTPAEAYNARRIHELYTIKMLDPSDKVRLQDIIVATFYEWSEDTEHRLTNFEGEQADWVQLARESAMIQRVRLAMLDGDYIEVKRLTDRYGSQVHNKDYRVALKHGLMSIAMQNQQHKSASQLLSDINRIEPEQEVAGWYEAPDYRPLADYLAYAQNHTGDKGGSVRLARYEGAANLSDDLAAAEPLPEQFALSANYPNPFNPVTSVPFALPESAEVRIEVFDIAGRRVATLVNRRYEAGSHQVSFDAGQLASGVYLIRAVMRTDDSAPHEFTQKMALVK